MSQSEAPTRLIRAGAQLQGLIPSRHRRSAAMDVTVVPVREKKKTALVVFLRKEKNSGLQIF